VKPQLTKDSKKHVEQMKRIRNMEEDQEADHIWEKLADFSVPGIVKIFTAASLVPQVGVLGSLIWLDPTSTSFTLATYAGSGLLATSACSFGAILIGMEVMRYHPLQIPSFGFTGAPRVWFGLLQMATGFVVVGAGMLGNWSGSVTYLVSSILGFTFILSSAKRRAFPYWVVHLGTIQLISTGVLSLFLMNSMKIQQRMRTNTNLGKT
jgi:hypothetical protein